jgi:hypothetical protein
MWCAHCLKLVDGTIDHELCKEGVWRAMSEEYTRVREKFTNQHYDEPEGETVEVSLPTTP